MAIRNGNAANNTLNGTAGEDIITGFGGNDVLSGGDSSDQIFGGTGNDTLIGGRGYDTLDGGAGNDLLDASSSDFSTDFYGDLVRPGMGTDVILGSQVVFDGGDGIDITYSEMSGVGGVTYVVDGTGAGTASSGTPGLFSSTFTWAHYFHGTQDGDSFNGALSAHAQNWIGYAGGDTFNGSAGYDRIDYGQEASAGGTGGISIEMRTGLATDAFGDTDTLSMIDSVWGTQAGDRMSANLTSGPVEFRGAGGNDTLIGGSGEDELFGGAGNDTLYGGGGDDDLRTGGGADIVIGGAGSDRVTTNFDFAFITGVTQSGANYTLSTATDSIRFREVEDFTFTDGDRSLAEVLALMPEASQTLTGTAGADSLVGGTGDDLLIGLADRDFLNGGLGADTMRGGLGNDHYIIDNIGDVIEGEIGYSQGGGIDTVRAFLDYQQIAHIEIVRLADYEDTRDLNATGTAAPGTLVGNAGQNVLNGMGGDDKIKGNGGDDILIGGFGQDTMNGGEGADVFVYTDYRESRAGRDTRDFINTYEHDEDQIDLSAMDANVNTGADDAFTFIGTTRFSGTAGELRTQTLGSQNAILIQADHDGDGQSDFQIIVNATNFMLSTDFIL